jgi:hypothetical protein
MKKNYCLLIVLCIISLATNAQKIIGTGLPSALFELREMDMHNHSGKERDAPLNKWIDLSVKDGRKVMVILDHLELYRMSTKETKEWTEERKFQNWYPTATDGHTAQLLSVGAKEERNIKDYESIIISNEDVKRLIAIFQDRQVDEVPVTEILTHVTPVDGRYPDITRIIPDESASNEDQVIGMDCKYIARISASLTKLVHCRTGSLEKLNQSHHHFLNNKICRFFLVSC